MFNLDDCVACITSKSAKAIAEALESKLLEINITRTQWIALYYISVDNQITQTILAKQMARKEASIVTLLNRMEKEDLICRKTTTDDKRKNYLFLTSKGEALKEKGERIVSDFKDLATSNIKEEDLDTYKKVLEKMVENTK